MTALVVGGRGFVGRHVTRTLREAGQAVVTLGRRGPGGPDHVQLDFSGTPAAALRAVLDRIRPAYVVNAAGGVWDCTGPDLVRRNVDLVDRLVEAVAGRPTRLIQLGSILEYGPGRPDRPLAEHDPPNPTTPYGRSKLAATDRVLRADGLDAVVLRLTNVVGADPPGASLMGRVSGALRTAYQKNEMAILNLAPLTAHRDFVDAGDVGRAVLAAARRAESGSLLNIGSGAATPVRSIVDILVALSDVPAKILEAREPDATRSLAVDWQHSDVRRAAAELGWRAERSLHDSLHDVWRSTGSRGAGVRLAGTGEAKSRIAEGHR